MTRVTRLSRIGFVIPVYNEAKSLPHFFAAMAPVLRPLADSCRFQFIFVNDGSNDETLPMLLAAQAEDPRILVLDLSRNFGKEAALTAGIDYADSDAVIPIDVDLQDPPEVIPQLIAQWRAGFDIVNARRRDRPTDSISKRLSARLYYKIHNVLADQKMPDDVGDFRLIDRKVVAALKAMPERRRFMKGLFSWVGFRSTVVDYERQPRAAGQSRLSAWKLWNLAIEGITGFSTLPLRIWTYIGAGVATFAFGYMGVILTRTLIYGPDVPGYPSLLMSILFIGGVQLIGIGVLGEYLGRVYIEVKQRPTYIIGQAYAGSDILKPVPTPKRGGALREVS
jgi:glycosyltransferase involved in cell wall biosynthesis